MFKFHDIDKIVEAFETTLNKLNAAAKYHSDKQAEYATEAKVHELHYQRASALAAKFEQFV